MSDDWHFEGPDPEVGIFGDMVVHNSCTTTEDPEPCGPPDIKITVNRRDPTIADITSTFTCPHCGATTDAVEQQPADIMDHERPGGSDAD